MQTPTIHYLADMQASHTATAFYARIKEAHSIENTEEKTRRYKQVLEILFRELSRKEPVHSATFLPACSFILTGRPFLLASISN